MQFSNECNMLLTKVWHIVRSQYMSALIIHGCKMQTKFFSLLQFSYLILFIKQTPFIIVIRTYLIFNLFGAVGFLISHYLDFWVCASNTLLLLLLYNMLQYLLWSVLIRVVKRFEPSTAMKWILNKGTPWHSPKDGKKFSLQRRDAVPFSPAFTVETKFRFL